MNEQQILKARMQMMIEEYGFGNIIDAMMRTMGGKEVDIEQTADMLIPLCRGASAMIATIALDHIIDHDGYDCAEEAIDGLSNVVREQSRYFVRCSCEDMGKPIPEEYSDTNVKTFHEVMEEIKREEKKDD